MLNKLEIALREELRKSDKRAFLWFFIAVAMTTGLVATIGLYIGRVNESQIVINCSSFISSDDASAFTINHPQYKKRLNPKNKAEACSSYKYGTTN